MRVLQQVSKSLFCTRGLRLLIAVMIGGWLAGPLPLSAMTTFAYPLLPAAAADNVAAVLTRVLPQPAVALAADNDTDAALPASIVLGNRLWLEDDFDERMLPTGVALLAGAAVAYLHEQESPPYAK